MSEPTGKVQEIGRMAFRAFGDLVHDGCFEHMSTFLAPQDIVPEMDIAAIDEQQPPLQDEIGDFLPRFLDKPGECRPGNSHFFSTLGMRKAFIVSQSEGLIFIQRQACLLKILETYANGLKFRE
jgi:hypothetical protein